MAKSLFNIFGSRDRRHEAQCATPPKARVPERHLPKDGGACWLEKTNPLIGLSIRTAQSIFDAARNGDTQRLHWIYQEIEAANPILFIGTERRQSAIANFQWDVAARPNADKALAEEQRQAVDEFLLGIPNLTKLLEHLDTAWFRGFAYAQPIWNEDGSLAEIVLHNSWEFLRKDGILFHNPSCNGWSRDCVSCEDAGLIGVECNRAIDYPALSIHIRHAVGERDWGRFLERYALPKPAVTMAANATNDQRGDYIIAAKAVENGQVSVWPNGSVITDFAGGSRGTDPFDKFIGHQEKTIILLATGGTLTSLAQSDTGALAGGAQMEVWKEIVGRDAGVLSQAVMQSLVRPFLERRFWGRPIAVDFSLNIPKKLSPKEAAEVAGLCRNAGYTVEQKELEKAVGFTLIPYDGPAPQPMSGFGAARKVLGAAVTDANGLSHGEDGKFDGGNGSSSASPKEEKKDPLTTINEWDDPKTIKMKQRYIKMLEEKKKLKEEISKRSAHVEGLKNDIRRGNVEKWKREKGLSKARSVSADSDESELLKAFAKDTSEAGKAVAALLKDLDEGKDIKDAANSLIERLPSLMPDDLEMAAVISEAMAEQFVKEDK